MKNVIKISISGLAFTMEEDGYVLLDRYLSQLKKYYIKQQNGMEVVEGIEERIAELLRERMGTPDEVVGKELVEQVMAIMGNPEDIEEENTGTDTRETYRRTAQEAKPRRRLYRNIDDRVLGGVCSGLGAYLNMEPLLFRIVFVVLALLSSFGLGALHHWFFHGASFSIGGWVVLAYIVLWAVVPAAKTVAQKCEMRGERPDFSGIQERVKRGVEHVERGIRNTGQHIRHGAESVGSEIARGVGRVLAVCVGILLLLIAVPVLIAVPASMIFSASWLYGVLPHGITSLVAFNGSLFWIQLLAALVCLLPFVGMLYGGIALVFRLRPQKFRPGLTIFIGWLISLLALMILLVIAARPYYGGVEEAREDVPVPLLSDTLYVHYTADQPSGTWWMEADASEAFLAWFKGERQSLRAVVCPQVRIVRVDSLQPVRLRLTGRAAGRTMDDALTRARESLPAYTLRDSLLTLLPDVYARDHRWQGNWGEVVIYLPQGKQVVLTSPYRHHFDRNAPRISRGTMWKHHRFGPGRHHWRNLTDDDRWERKWERWERYWDD